MPRQIWLYSLVALVLLWCVGLPTLATYSWAHMPSFNYAVSLLMFRPDLIAAVGVLFCVPFAFRMHRASAIAFACIGLALPLLVFTLGTAGDLWPVSTALLFLLSWRLFAQSARQA